MKQIKIIQKNGTEHIILVDDSDFEEVNQYKWHVQRGGDTFYVLRNIYLGYVDGKKKSKKIAMHRQLLEIDDSKIFIDHINHNGLDNRRENLRICNNRRNQYNSKPQKGAASRYKGVSWSKQNNKWIAQININGKNKYLGYFTIEEDARDAYEKVAKGIQGDFKNISIEK